MEAISSVSLLDRTSGKLTALGELMKPELTGLSVLTAVFSAYVANPEGASVESLVLLAFATLMVGGGAGTLNQWIEREYDAQMKRTERRPIPTGRISPPQALLFGLGLTLAGNVLLLLEFGAISCFYGISTTVLYVLVYTPLKRKTWHNTTVGAIPGALPVIIGWSTTGAPISTEAWILFLIVFAWQYPHFLSLAWMYRRDYARAGFKMLSVLDDEHSGRTARLNVLTTIGLTVLCLLLATYEGYGPWFMAGAIGANGVMLYFAVRAWLAGRATPAEAATINRRARGLFFASLAHLPIIMVSTMIDTL